MGCGIQSAYDLVVRRLRAWATLFALVLFGGLLGAALPGSAAAQLCSGIPGLLQNGSFEAPDILQPSPPAARIFGTSPDISASYDDTNVPGWSTTAPDGEIEIWASGFNGVDSFEGAQHAEVNANQFGALFQDLVTTANSEIVWSFAHRGRSGVDTVEVLIGPQGGPLLSQGTFSTDNDDWDLKSGSYVVPAGQTITRFQFLAVSTANGSISVGNFVDAVRIAPECDYGDAPATYPVTRANNGAAHRISPGAFLGSAVDAETDGIGLISNGT